MSGSPSEEARRQLAGPTYRPLWVAARDRLERSGLVLTNRPISVDAAGQARADIAGLMGVSPAGRAPLQVRLDELDRLLRTGAPAIDLLALLELLDGPLKDRRAIRAARTSAVADGWQSLSRHRSVRIHPRLAEWLDGQRSSGIALRLARSVEALEPLLRQGLEVLERLPVEAEPLAVFAARATGDPHALDRDTKLGSVVASALPYVDAPPGPQLAAAAWSPIEPDDDERGARRWRDAWAKVGVVCDDLSVSVLALNLPASGDGPVARSVIGHRRAGLPLRLTLQQLRSEPLEIPPGVIVRTCENPSVLATASSLLAENSSPLICTDGQPNGAVDEILRQARASGSPLLHHGDFDWGGIRAANWMVARHGAEPWRFSTGDYHAVAHLGRVQLEPAPTRLTAQWCPSLVEAMAERRLKVFEEQIVETLLEDLGS